MQDGFKKLTLVTRHYFSAHGRQTTVHFIARQFARRGYRIDFITVGRSRLSLALKKGGGIPPDINRRHFTEVEKNIRTIVMDEYIHPVSTGSAVINLLTRPEILHYGACIPSNIKEEISGSDIVLIECGYGVAYYKTLRSLCKNAFFIYFATDPLSQVGLRPEFEHMEQAVIHQFDLVRVASPDLAARFPANTKVITIPQGLDKSVFDAATDSPYVPGSKNFISIGDMAFDQNAIIAMAEAEPDARLHVFGAKMAGPYPANITVYGETPFMKLVPYIKFADVGIMPYKITEHMAYLAKTSLKFLQYSYCGLPIVTPYGPEWNRANIFQYKPGDAASIAAAIQKARAAPKDPALASGVVDWSECADLLIEARAKSQGR